MTVIGHNTTIEFAKIHDFGATFAAGQSPSGRLIVDAFGRLYGVASRGGQSYGLVFMLVPQPGGIYQYQILYTFRGGPTDGAFPIGGLMMDAAGALYGTTAGGGSGWTGTVFKLTSDGSGNWSITNLYQFSQAPAPAGTNSDGAGPTAHLIMDTRGNLYGTTSQGGANGGGTVFKLTRWHDGSYTFANLHNFAGPPVPGGDPNDTTGALVMDAAGNLYGLKAAGGVVGAGEIFALYSNNDPLKYNYEQLVSFPAPMGDPELPFGSLVIDGSGQLFGTTNAGGTEWSGSVFKCTTGPQPELATLYSFSQNSAWSPLAGVIMDGAGNLFGTTQYYGSSGAGAVYKLINVGSGSYVYVTLFEFTEYKRQGGYAGNTLVADSLGHLFGTTPQGGTFDGGTVYKITKGETAQAIAVMEAGVVVRVVVTKPGRGYDTPPVVTITPPTNGMTAQAVATIANGSVTAVTVTNQGSGYDFGPQVGFSPP